MKRSALFLGVFFLGVLAFAQESRPRIAVLDAVLLDESPAWNTSVQLTITDIILEYIITQGNYIVLDRSNVDQVFNEIAFQVSGLVRDSEVRQAGVYLGADFVCVIRVGHPFEDVYGISAKIINVESGEVVAQTSQNERGSISVLLDAAYLVGSRLTGITLPTAPITTALPTQPVSPVQQPQQPVQQPQWTAPGEEAKQEPIIVYEPSPAVERQALPSNFVGVFYGGASAEIWDDFYGSSTEDGSVLGLYSKFGFLTYFSLRPSMGLINDDLFIMSIPVVLNLFPNSLISPFLGAYWGILGDYSGGVVLVGADLSLGRHLVLSFDLQIGTYSDEFSTEIYGMTGVVGGAWRF